MEFAKFKDRCRGHINLNDLSKALAQQRQQQMHVVPKNHAEAGDDAREITTQRILEDCPIDLMVPPGFAFSAGGVEQVQNTENNGEKRELSQRFPYCPDITYL